MRKGQVSERWGDGETTKHFKFRIAEWDEERGRGEGMTRPFKDWGHCVGDTVKIKR